LLLFDFNYQEDSIPVALLEFRETFRYDIDEPSCPLLLRSLLFACFQDYLQQIPLLIIGQRDLDHFKMNPDLILEELDDDLKEYRRCQMSFSLIVYSNPMTVYEEEAGLIGMKGSYYSVLSSLLNYYHQIVHCSLAKGNPAPSQKICYVL